STLTPSPIPSTEAVPTNLRKFVSVIERIFMVDPPVEGVRRRGASRRFLRSSPARRPTDQPPLPLADPRRPSQSLLGRCHPDRLQWGPAPVGYRRGAT